MTSAENQSRHRGFTLIELLVAFSILGLVVTAAFSALGTSLTMWSTGHDRIGQSRQRNTALAILHDQVQTALPLALRAEDGERIGFLGASDRLDFASPVSFRRPDSVPRWVRIYWNRDLIEPRLTIEERRVLSPDNTAEAEPYATRSIPGVDSFEIGYLLRAGRAEEAQWLDAWPPEQRSELPAAVRIVIGFEGNLPREMLMPLDYAQTNWDGLVLR